MPLGWGSEVLPHQWATRGWGAEGGNANLLTSQEAMVECELVHLFTKRPHLRRGPSRVCGSHSPPRSGVSSDLTCGRVLEVR